MTSKDYVKLSIENVERQFKKRNMKFPSRAVTPMKSEFIPELDTSKELSPDDTTFYQELIGILRWAVEIGRVDILTELLLLSFYQASPRRGNLEQLLHIFAYLEKASKTDTLFQPSRACFGSKYVSGSFHRSIPRNISWNQPRTAAAYARTAWTKSLHNGIR